MLNMNKVIQHIWGAIRDENVEIIAPIFDQDRPIRSTNDMRDWYTSRPIQETTKSHVNFCVLDSRWEASEAYALDKHNNVQSWVKNDHLGFEIWYKFQGVSHRYRPDFIIRLKNGNYLVLETKGEDDQQNQVKRAALDEWVQAVNTHGGFGEWGAAVSFHPSDLDGILERVA